MNIFTIILIKFIKGYRFLISPLLGHSCRYLPTCSEYSIEALTTYGFFQRFINEYKKNSIMSSNKISWWWRGI
jgi:putative membrane protein insertion efficiency factor